MSRAAALLLTGLVVTASAAAQGPAATAQAGALMTVGRLHYDGGGDWYANPSSLPNLLGAIRTRTGLQGGPARSGSSPSGTTISGTFPTST